MILWAREAAVLDPIVYCTTCKRQRNVRLHARADDPPAAARKWLARLCLREGYQVSMQKACDVRYRAGFAIGGPAVGQGSTGDFSG